MAKDTTVYISIGRGVDGHPMPVSDWHRFAAEVNDVVDNYHGLSFYRGFGQGQYEGSTEDAYVIGASINARMVEPLRLALSTLADKYSQECIGLVVGTTDFVTP